MKTASRIWEEVKCAFGFHDWTTVWHHGTTGKYRCKRFGCSAMKFEINS